MEPQEPVLKWVAFDLDDTLHSFRKASAEAMEAVYGYVYEEFGVLLDVQRQAYMDILAKGQSGNFIEDKPANDYRSERFGALLSSFNILPHIHLNMMLEIYDRALERTLEVKDGAHDFGIIFCHTFKPLLHIFDVILNQNGKRVPNRCRRTVFRAFWSARRVARLSFLKSHVVFPLYFTVRSVRYYTSCLTENSISLPYALFI